MKRTLLFLIILTYSITNSFSQQIYKDLRHSPTDEESLELLEIIIRPGNGLSSDSLVNRVRNKHLEDNNFEAYAFITNEYGIYLYYRGQLKEFDELLENSRKNIEKLEVTHFESLLFNYFQTLSWRIKSEYTLAAQLLCTIKDNATAGDYPILAKTCSIDLTSIYLRLSDYEKAFRTADLVLELSQPLTEKNNYIDVAALYTNIGVELLNIDDQLANNYLTKAVDLFENTDGPHGQLSYRIMAMGALCRNYTQQKKFDQAIAVNKRRLKLALDSIHTGKLPATSLSETYEDFYYIYYESNNFNKMKEAAHDYYNSCEEQQGETNSRQYNNSLKFLGYAHTMNGELDTALTLLKESINETTKLYDTPFAAPAQQFYMYLADTYYQRGEYADAEQSFKDALRCLIQSSGDSILTQQTLSYIPEVKTYNTIESIKNLNEILFQAYLQENNPRYLYDIIRYGQLNERMLIDNHHLSQNEEAGLSYSKKLKDNNLLPLKAAELLSNKYHQNQYADTAFALSEKTKLFHLRNKKSIANIVKTIPDSIISHYLSINKKLNQSQDTYPPEERFNLNNELFLSRLQLDHYFKDQDTNNVYAISTNNCPENHAYISYSIYNETLFISAFNNKSQIIKKITAPELKNTTQNLIRKIKTGEDYTKEQKLLSEILIKPTENIIKGQSYLTIIPDSYLFKTPFEILISDDKKLLIEDYNINYQYAYTNTIKERVKNPTLLAISPFAEENVPLSNEIAEVLRSSINKTSLRGDDLVKLPYSGKEVRGISKLFTNKGFPVNIMSGEKANKQDLIDALADNNILHFATHGISNNNDEETGLFLSQNVNDETVSSFLNLNELYHLQLNEDLVVLSACNSGMGNIKDGEGVMSLPRGFIYAGVPNVLASLWKVHDKMTKELMISFYGHLLKEDLNYNEALRLAKLDGIKKGYNAMDWASFILISE